VVGDPAELREVLTNLIFNAVHAMPEGGTITISTRAEAEQVILEVSDTGSGMTEEVRRRCLEPFYTTKGEKGTGLGLAMVYGIAERHHAVMDLESEIGRGTTFRFRFPATAWPGGGGGAAGIQWARPLKILVVDDQEFIREILTIFLGEDCHIAVARRGWQRSAGRLERESFDLLITDQAMPDMTGGQLAAAAKERAPGMRIILLTGFGAGESPEEGADAIDLVVGKPVTKEALRQAIARVAVI
jgi:CheY-like chemotaxis protein